jgi:hypothetical protein
MHLSRLGKTEFKQLTELQNTIRKGGSGAAELDDYRTELQVIDQALATFGLDKNADENKTAVARLQRMVAERTTALQRLTGKKATNEDVQGIVDDILSVTSVTHGSWWNILPYGKPFNDVSKRVIDMTIDDVSSADRRLITEALQQAGRSVNDEAILQLYISSLLARRRGGG